MKDVDKTRIKCNHCGDILKPDGYGTMIWCSCGKCAVDGKYDKNREGYCRIIGNEEDYINLTLIKSFCEDMKEASKYTSKKH